MMHTRGYLDFEWLGSIVVLLYTHAHTSGMYVMRVFFLYLFLPLYLSLSLYYIPSAIAMYSFFKWSKQRNAKWQISVLRCLRLYVICCILNTNQLILSHIPSAEGRGSNATAAVERSCSEGILPPDHAAACKSKRKSRSPQNRYVRQGKRQVKRTQARKRQERRPVSVTTNSIPRSQCDALQAKTPIYALGGKRRRVPKFPFRNHKKHGSEHIWPGNSSARCIGGIAVRLYTPGMAVASAATTKILWCILRPPSKKEKMKEETNRDLFITADCTNVSPPEFSSF
jgi:hypothetical protein